MEHWADKYSDQVSGTTRSDQIRLEEGKIIRAAFPDVWVALKERVNQDAEILRAKFPGQAAYDLDVALERAGTALETLVIRRKSFPFRNISITPKIDARVLNLIKAPDLDTTGTPERFERDVIRIAVSQSDLNFYSGGKLLLGPVQLSESLFSYVCANT